MGAWNWIFLLLFLGFIGMHFFGHGCGGHGSHKHGQQNNDGLAADGEHEPTSTSATSKMQDAAGFIWDPKRK